MANTQVQTLLGAVRRRLWRVQIVAAVRLAVWGSAGLMLLAVAVHLVARPVPPGALLLACAVLWASMLAWAGSRRPTDPACALWADRHLGGASAFTTLFELEGGLQGSAKAQAVRWLERWATAKVPDGLRLLAARQDHARLSRSLLAMLVCTALAALVLSMPDLAPSSRQPLAAPSPSGNPDRSTLVAEAPESAQLVNDMASALRSAASRDEQERPEAGRAPAAGTGKTSDGKAPLAAQPGAKSQGEAAPVKDMSPGMLVDAAPTAGTTQATGAGSGREASESRDNRGDIGTSRVLRSAINVQRFQTLAARPAGESQADMDRSALYDDALSLHGAAPLRADGAAAAATPPPATDAARLTPTETTYVQAWMKASGRGR